MDKATRPKPNSEVEVALGEAFRKVRKRQKVSLRALSEALGVSINTLRWAEAGARSMRMDMIVRAAAYMGVDPRELIPEGIAATAQQEA